MNVKVVINANYGGFSIDEEIKQWLINNKSWKEEFFGNCYSGDYYISDPNFRTNSDFVECVETLQSVYREEFKKATITERRELRTNHKALELKVVFVEFFVEVEDYRDGIERVVASYNIDE